MGLMIGPWLRSTSYYQSTQRPRGHISGVPAFCLQWNATAKPSVRSEKQFGWSRRRFLFHVYVGRVLTYAHQAEEAVQKLEAVIHLDPALFAAQLRLDLALIDFGNSSER